MKRIQIQASKSYEVMIGENLLSDIGFYASAAVCGRRAVIVTDNTVRLLYAEKVQDSLEKSGFAVSLFSVAPGEKSKNTANYINLLNYLAAENLTRKDAVIALGGGVVGDLAGFAAATYLRGIGLIQIPTTLLAAVDSSVGGKSAVNLDTGKNLAGAFYHPAFVLCDTVCLRTLPEEVFRDGAAEIIKYGIIADAGLFFKLYAPLMAQIEDITAACISIKGGFVKADEFDRGRRRLLNFGHTIGHAVEVCSGFSLTHGSAVAMGMAAMAKAALANGDCSAECCSEIQNMLLHHGFCPDIPFGVSEIYQAARSDKKAGNDSITMIVAQEIGKCVCRNVSFDTFYNYLRKGLG